MDKISSPPSSTTPSTDIPTAFSPTSSQISMKEIEDLLIPMGIPGSQIALPPEIAQFLAQHGFTGSDGLPSPFVFSNKSVTTSHGVTENGERFTQQHYTVNTHEWYTPRHLGGGKGEGAEEGRKHTTLLDGLSRELREMEEKRQMNEPKQTMDEEKGSPQVEHDQKVSKLRENFIPKRETNGLRERAEDYKQEINLIEKFNQKDLPFNVESKVAGNKIFRRLNREPAPLNQEIQSNAEKDSKDFAKLVDNKRFNHAKLLQNLSDQMNEARPNCQPTDSAERTLKTEAKTPKHFDFNLIKSYGVASKPSNKQPNEVLFEKLRQEIKDFDHDIQPSKVAEKTRIFNEKPSDKENGSGGGAARVWRPEITQNTEMSKFQDSTHQLPYKVSLEHNNSSVPPKGFNNAALPFNTDPRVKHLQYNSPMNLYSTSAAAEQYAQQTQGVVNQDSSASRARSDQPSYMRSETLKVLKEQEQNGHSSHPNPQGLPVCYVCTRPILGLMAQAAGHQLHADCLACATCGTSLKNIGHHYIDGKFYCDIHQRLKRATSIGPSEPNLMARMPPTAAQPTRPIEPPRGAYQPDGINRRPLSVSPNPNTNQWSSTQQTLNVSVSNPKTQGVISPANRGVPSSQMYGTDLNRGVSRGTQDYRPSSTLAPPSGAPPPPPSSQPPIGNAYAANRQSHQQTTRATESHTLNQPVQGGKVPYCEACKQQIRGAFVLAQGLSWCPEHFICANASCGRRLLECGFVEENGQKFCENCFENNIAPRCAKCARPIISDCLNALQKKWHPQCFTCAHCSKPFGNSAFYLEQGLPYCENDWNRLFTTKCYQCTYPIEAGDRWVEALGHAYHSNCFNCTRCQVNLEGESFYAKNGEPFCKLHA